MLPTVGCLSRNARIAVPIFNVAQSRFVASEGNGQSNATNGLEELRERLKATKHNLISREQLTRVQTRRKWAHIFEEKVGKKGASKKPDWWEVFHHYNSYPTNTLLVANLPYEALPDDLLQAFKTFDVLSIRIGVNESGYTQGYAHVEMESVAEAADVLAIGYDFYCKGRRLDIHPSRPINKALYDFLPPSDTLHIRYFTKNLPNVRSIIKKVLSRQKRGVVDFFEFSGTPGKLGYIQFETEERCQAALKTIREYCTNNAEDSRLLVMFSTLERPKLGDELSKWTEDASHEGAPAQDVSFEKEMEESI